MNFSKRFFGSRSGPTPPANQRPAESARVAREIASRESAEKDSFMLAAIAADEAWMRANDQAQLDALKRSDKAEWNRLFKEKGDRLRAAKGDMFEYLQAYYPQLWHKNR